MAKNEDKIEDMDVPLMSVDSNSYKNVKKPNVPLVLDEQALRNNAFNRKSQQMRKSDVLTNVQLKKFMKAEREHYEKLIQFEKDQNEKLEKHYNESL